MLARRSRILAEALVFSLTAGPVYAADPQSYAVEITGAPSREADAALRASSQLVALAGTAPLPPFALVTRARDLFAATHVHRLLQALLDLPVPRWHHHALLTDAAGKRFAKRDRATSLRELREAGAAPEQVRAMVERVATDSAARHPAG